MPQSYAYVANESTPARIKLNHNIHIPSDIHDYTDTHETLVFSRIFSLLYDLV